MGTKRNLSFQRDHKRLASTLVRKKFTLVARVLESSIGEIRALLLWCIQTEEDSAKSMVDDFGGLIVLY